MLRVLETGRDLCWSCLVVLVRVWYGTEGSCVVAERFVWMSLVWSWEVCVRASEVCFGVCGMADFGCGRREVAEIEE